MHSGTDLTTPPQSRAAYVADRLKQDVANGTIPPGELIKQTVLAKRYGVSATPVREAMRILEADGVLTYSPHKGATVREMTPESARDLYRLRSAVERTATEMAVERMTPDALDIIRARYKALSEALRHDEVSPAELSILNREFHFSIYQQSSPLVVQYLELLWARFTPPATLFMDRATAKELHEEHALILHAVEQADAARAGELAAAHTLRAADLREQSPELRAAGDDEHQSFT